ncbi:MAG: hypothetical protein ACRDO7_04570 [Nocardioidaceae bacterium]
MFKKPTLRSFVVAGVTLGAAILGPVAQADDAPEAGAAQDATKAHGITAADLARTGSERAAPLPGWDVPNPRSYYLEASCAPYAGAIRQGAAAWNGLTEGGGTPVECRDSYITDCGGGGNIVGCNWGQGQRIALYMGGVNDDALLAAHEFGHDWYGHSSFQCAGWGSPEEVMSPTICNAPATGGKVLAGQM